MDSELRAQQTEVNRIFRTEYWRGNCTERKLKSCRGCPLSVRRGTEQRVSEEITGAVARNSASRKDSSSSAGNGVCSRDLTGNLMLHTALSRVLRRVLPLRGE